MGGGGSDEIFPKFAESFAEIFMSSKFQKHRNTNTEDRKHCIINIWIFPTQINVISNIVKQYGKAIFKIFKIDCHYTKINV